MRYLLAVLLPPLAMFLCGKVFQAVACFVLMLTVIGWPVASIWALLVVHNHNEEVRAGRIIRAVERGEDRGRRSSKP